MNSLPDGGLSEFWLDWDFRQEKVTGCPRHFLGIGHPIPVFEKLAKKKEPSGG